MIQGAGFYVRDRSENWGETILDEALRGKGQIIAAMPILHGL